MMPRRPIVALLIAAALLAACRDEGRPESSFPQLPDEAPAVTGVVYGVGRPDDYYDITSPYEFQRYGRARRVDLPARNLTTFAADAETLAVIDGRLVAYCCTDTGPDHLLAIESAETATPVEKFPESWGLTEIAGARVATVENANKQSGVVDHVLHIRSVEGNEIEAIDVGNTVLTPPAPTAEGGFAVLVQRPGGDGPADRASLVSFSPAGVPVHESALGDLSRTQGSGFSAMQLAISNTGLVAVFTGDTLAATSRYNASVVFKTQTGERLRSFRGWHGGAWSPDGTGLLLARVKSKTAPRTTELALAYGPKLAKFKKLGVIEGEFVPLRWLAQPLPGA